MDADIQEVIEDLRITFPERAKFLSRYRDRYNKYKAQNLAYMTALQRPVVVNVCKCGCSCQPEEASDG